MDFRNLDKDRYCSTRTPAPISMASIMASQRIGTQAGFPSGPGEKESNADDDIRQDNKQAAQAQTAPDF